MQELHLNGIIHRDLKHENIMQSNGEFKIIDFGFCKNIGMAGDGYAKHTVLGTVTTMAPEVARKEHYSLKVDIL